MGPQAMKPDSFPARMVLAALAVIQPALAGTAPGNDGGVILGMCRGADKVKALSVMCHSYLNGFLDGARHYGKDGKTSFCLEGRDKERAPAVLVNWITAHPESRGQPAGMVLQAALTEHFPCKGGK